MIGNDIVDLQQSRTESNWQRKGWLCKLFSNQEIESIKLSPNPEITVWLYWSMKEAAYKIYNRMSGKSSFAPSKFVCNITACSEDTANGYVSFDNILYHTHSSISKDYIHSIAQLSHSQSVQILIEVITKDMALPNDFSLQKNNSGLPYLLNNKSGATLIASKSHHGLFQALIY